MPRKSALKAKAGDCRNRPPECQGNCCRAARNSGWNPTSPDRREMKTIVLLFCSNVFMTFAWYGHLKYGHSWPLWKAILVSWLIALLEYCLAVPANRIGYGAFTGFQLKIVQEAITVGVFIIFA